MSELNYGDWVKLNKEFLNSDLFKDSFEGGAYGDVTPKHIGKIWSGVLTLGGSAFVDVMWKIKENGKTRTHIITMMLDHLEPSNLYKRTKSDE